MKIDNITINKLLMFLPLIIMVVVLNTYIAVTTAYTTFFLVQELGYSIFVSKIIGFVVGVMAYVFYWLSYKLWAYINNS